MSQEELIRNFSVRLKVPDATAKKLAAEFLKAVHAKLKTAWTAFAEGNHERLAAAAHALKGCAANAGCDPLRQMALELQRCAQKGEDGHPLLEKITEEIKHYSI